jgi:hypothetical protein
MKKGLVGVGKGWDWRAVGALPFFCCEPRREGTEESLERKRSVISVWTGLWLTKIETSGAENLAIASTSVGRNGSRTNWGVQPQRAKAKRRVWKVSTALFAGGPLRLSFCFRWVSTFTALLESKLTQTVAIAVGLLGVAWRSRLLVRAAFRRSWGHVAWGHVSLQTGTPALRGAAHILAQNKKSLWL